MKHFDIRSKAYCAPEKKELTWYVITNIAVICIALISIGSMLIKGINAGNISGCIIAILVGILIRIKNRKDGRYVSCNISVDVNDTELCVSYQPQIQRKLIVYVNSIRSLEYSDRLACLRLICDYLQIDGDGTNLKNNAEVLLYIEYDANQPFYDAIAEATGKTVCFVDRTSGNNIC